ncbi:hypothetical protein Bbelb_386730 [Branchiostoma belcheri]|nr:hypothetical protein Bbelb_386730 [Branchiostoma belcheri]
MPARLLNPAGASRGYIPDGHLRNWDLSLTKTVLPSYRSCATGHAKFQQQLRPASRVLLPPNVNVIRARLRDAFHFQLCKKQGRAVETFLVPGRGSNPRPPGASLQSDAPTASAKRSRPIGRVSW